MPDIRIPDGPIESEPVNAIVPAPGELPRRAATAAVLAALEGVELGAYDREILAWLAGWEPSTVATVCSWLQRVREASRA